MSPCNQQSLVVIVCVVVILVGIILAWISRGDQTRDNAGVSKDRIQFNFRLGLAMIAVGIIGAIAAPYFMNGCSDEEHDTKQDQAQQTKTQQEKPAPGTANVKPAQQRQRLVLVEPTEAPISLDREGSDYVMGTIAADEISVGDTLVIDLQYEITPTLSSCIDSEKHSMNPGDVRIPSGWRCTEGLCSLIGDGDRSLKKWTFRKKEGGEVFREWGKSDTQTKSWIYVVQNRQAITIRFAYKIDGQWAGGRTFCTREFSKLSVMVTAVRYS